MIEKLIPIITYIILGIALAISLITVYGMFWLMVQMIEILRG